MAKSFSSLAFIQDAANEIQQSDVTTYDAGNTSLKDEVPGSKGIPIYHKLCLTINEAAVYSNIGINRLEQMLNEKECPFRIIVGNRKKLIKRKEFEEYISTRVAI